MTLPYEERMSLKYARQFLLGLLDPKKTPKVPGKVRKEACAKLRHFPADYKIDELYDNKIE